MGTRWFTEDGAITKEHMEELARRYGDGAPPKWLNIVVVCLVLMTLGIAIALCY